MEGVFIELLSQNIYTEYRTKLHKQNLFTTANILCVLRNNYWYKMCINIYDT